MANPHERKREKRDKVISMDVHKPELYSDTQKAVHTKIDKTASFPKRTINMVEHKQK